MKIQNGQLMQDEMSPNVHREDCHNISIDEWPCENASVKKIGPDQWVWQVFTPGFYVGGRSVYTTKQDAVSALKLALNFYKTGKYNND